MEQREETIRRWFDMWLRGEDLGIRSIFSQDAVYIESWGPAYHGVDEICHWFAEWNTRGKVLTWEIKQFFHRDSQTVVEWFFRNRMNDGREEAFDGLSLVKWTADGKIAFLQEFGCNRERYDPYADGPVPKFQGKAALWF